MQKLETRSRQIIVNLRAIERSEIRLPTISNTISKRACSFVHDCINGNANVIFDGFFEVVNHSIATRNNQFMIKLPKVKNEFGRKRKCHITRHLYTTNYH